MKTRGDVFGRGCLWVSLTAVYGLLGMRVFVAWQEGLWLDWPLGDYLPDSVVRWVFALPNASTRAVLVWILGRDVLYHAAVLSLLLWLVTLRGGSQSVGKDGHSPR